MEFYDGTTLIATCTEKPYKATLTGATAAKHTLKAVATDNDGETSTATIEVPRAAVHWLVERFQLRSLLP